MKITIEMVLLSHQLIIESTGGIDGVRDLDLLESVIEGVYNTFDGKDVYPTKEDKAAYLTLGLIKNHSFFDGNKRTGINVMLSYLNMNGIKIMTNNKELEDLGKSIAASTLNTDLEKERIKKWIIVHETI